MVEINKVSTPIIGVGRRILLWSIAKWKGIGF